MFSYSVRRIVGLLPVVIGISLLVFFSIRLIPGDPAVTIAGPQASGQDVQRMRERLGLDKPVHVQYVQWLGQVVTGDFGNSVRTGAEVAPLVMQRTKMTLLLAVTAILIASALGIVLGVQAAVRVHQPTDYVMSLASILGISLPVFWSGLMLMYFFSVELRWFPTSGSGTWKHLVLPSVTLALNSIAIIARTTRSCVLEVMPLDYVRTALAKGVSDRVVIYKHMLKNALIPVVTVIGLQFGYLMGGAVVTEVVFSWPGLGRLLTEAIFLRDFPVLQAGVLIVAVSFVLVNFLTDLVVATLDPRVALS